MHGPGRDKDVPATVNVDGARVFPTVHLPDSRGDSARAGRTTGVAPPSVRAAARATDGRERATRMRIVIADAYPIELEALRRLFEDAGFDVVACCGDGKDCLSAIRAHRPDILVLDAQLPGKQALAILAEMKRQGLATQAVLLSNKGESQVVEAIRLGVRSVVLKEMPPQFLIDCVRRVHAEGPSVDKPAASRLLDKLLRGRAARSHVALDLTRREREILKLVASGLRNRAIAERLSVTEGTVKIHLHNIYKKLSVPNRLALTLLAQERRFTQ